MGELPAKNRSDRLQASPNLMALALFRIFGFAPKGAGLRRLVG